MAQLLLIPDARPLDHRLGKHFFRSAPRRPGVYLMKAAGGEVVYVGKAKDLKQRLGYYRVANPDRMPRRHLRLVREVRVIEFQFCPSEAAALAHEATLLRSLKPKFNRAGVWPSRPGFLVWRALNERLEMAVVETPEPGWRRYGPLGGEARYLHASFMRLLWLATHQERSAAELPVGWTGAGFKAPTALLCAEDSREVLTLLDAFFWEAPAHLLDWIRASVAGRTTAFERNLIALDMETLQAFAGRQPLATPHRQQLSLL
jgi:predicted GIY-YIG superfamily endonuclease